MKKIEYTKGVGIPHQKFEDEFLAHKKVSEWWYTTGYVEDASKNMYAFQFTITKMKMFGIPFHMLLTSVTDLQTEKHYYGQRVAFFNLGITTNKKATKFGKKAGVKYSPNEKCSFGNMDVFIHTEDYKLNLNLEAQKAPVWNCQDGKLLMGVMDDPKQVTYYFSITNMLATGTLEIEGKKLNIGGKAWFDKQGGTYDIASPKTHWEWFSFRFFDEEEIMLFDFPQGKYGDGTYINKKGEYQRLNNYKIIPDKIIEEPQTNYKFSYGWTVKMPGIKDETYTIKPKIEGQFNVSFYELIVDIIDKDNKLVGYGIVELLPGVRNEKINTSLTFKKKK